MLTLIAAAAALVPIDPQRVERQYSRGVYPRIQQQLTALSNLVPVALLDVAAILLLVVLLSVFIGRVRTLGFGRAVGRTLVTVVGTASVVYLLFLALWGLNYRRVSLEEKLDYDKARITRESVMALANRAVELVNGGHGAAHRTASVDLGALGRAFSETETSLGAERYTIPGVPKASLLSWYFRRAAVDGMTDPWFLEIIVNPDLLEVERPAVVAHEWAHLAGYANEAEANFISWLTCLRGDPLAQYSGWLTAYGQALRALPRGDRAAVKPLDPGPREDLRAMSARYQRSSPAVRKAAQEVYDEYLRANRVAEGIGSYDAVLRLMVGTRFQRGWNPALR